MFHFSLATFHFSSVYYLSCPVYVFLSPVTFLRSSHFVGHLVFNYQWFIMFPQMRLHFTHIQITAWNRVLLEKPSAQLVKQSPTFHGTLRFIIVFMRTFHWTLSSSRWINSTAYYPIFFRPIFSLLSLFWKIKVGFWGHLLACVSVCPTLSLLGNGSVNTFPLQRLHMQQ
jgi:hypothetical protein